MRSIHDIIFAARCHLGKGDMESSARLCLADSIRFRNNGDILSAGDRALRSLAYSLGIFSPIYQQAADLLDEMKFERSIGVEKTERQESWMDGIAKI